MELDENYSLLKMWLWGQLEGKLTVFQMQKEEKPLSKWLKALETRADGQNKQKEIGHKEQKPVRTEPHTASGNGNGPILASILLCSCR